MNYHGIGRALDLPSTAEAKAAREALAQAIHNPDRLTTADLIYTPQATTDA